MKINVTIPVWNEAAILPISIPFLMEELEQGLIGYDWKVIISDNNSSDNTAEVAKDLLRKHANLIYSKINIKGRGYALKNSWNDFKADFYCYIDVDLDTHPVALIDAIKKL